MAPEDCTFVGSHGVYPWALLVVAGFIFWNAVLPFYGLLYLWGGQ